MKNTLAALFCLLAFCSGETASLLSPEMEDLWSSGVQALMNMDYDTARSDFEAMTRTEPDHPAGWAYLAETVWLGHLASLRRLQTGIYNRGQSFFAKTEDPLDPKVDKEFRDLLDHAVNNSEALLARNKKDPAGLYYLGISKTTLAGYEATVKRSFFSALRNGSKGVGLHRDLLKADPGFVDAKLSVGMYEYVAGSLPFAVKILVFLGGVHGSKTKGLKMLEEVANDGHYAKVQAQVMLVMLYDREKRWKDSLKMLEELSSRYPGNSLFQMEKALTLTRMGKLREGLEAFDAMLANPRVMDYMPDLVHYQYAVALADSKQWEKALEHYRETYHSEKAPEALVTSAHLAAGRCLDVLERRDEAKAEYEIVLKRRDAYDSHDDAKKYLKKPWQPGHE